MTTTTEETVEYDSEYEPLTIHKATIDRLLKCEAACDCISLYTFYYYTAKWQGTSVVKATVGYCSKGLKMSSNRVKAARKQLAELGLIEDVHRQDSQTGKVIGWYVRVKFVVFKTTSTKTTGVDHPLGGKQATNALSTDSINALSNSSGVVAPAKTENKATANSSILERDAEFVAQFNRKLSKKFRVMPKKASHQLTARLKEGYTVDEILQAALACSRTEHHRKNKHYLTPEFITRDDKLQTYSIMDVEEDNWVQDRVNGRGVQNMQGLAVNADGLTHQQWKEDRDVCAK